MTSHGVFSYDVQLSASERIQKRFDSVSRYTKGTIVRLISEVVPYNESIVDIGAGSGEFVKDLCIMGYDVFGLDGTPKIQEITNGDVHRVDICGDCSRYYRCADWGLFLEVGEHISKHTQDEAIRQVCAIPKKGLIVSWANSKSRGRGHVNCKAPKDVIKLFVSRGWLYDSKTSDYVNRKIRRVRRHHLVFRREPYNKPIEWASKRLIKVINKHFTSRTIYAAEVGVWRGRNAYHLLKEIPNLKLWCIDPYIRDLVDPHLLNVSVDVMDAKCLAFHTLEQYKERVRWILLKSTQAAKWFNPSSFHFVYLDGDHKYESVKEDIETWWPLIRNGGIMAGHDYQGMKDRIGVYGVKRAVHEFFGGDKVNTFPDKSRVWWVKKEN